MKYLLPFVSLAVLGLASGQEDRPKPPSPPEVGQGAPQFRLNDHAGKAVQVGGESEQWTVLAFFPKAATPG